MTRLAIALCALSVFAVAPAMAQNRSPLPPPLPNHVAPSSPLAISPGEVTATPEMWFYQQELEQYHDPKLAVRRKAEFRAEQRQRRMAALKWFGFSNQRPTAGVDCLHGDYSPAWTANNSHYPFRWSGYGQPWVAAVPVGRVLY